MNHRHRITTVWNSGGLGASVNFLADGSRPPTRRILNHRQNDSLENFDSNIPAATSPSGNGRRVLWGCAEPPPDSLRLWPTAIEISLRPTYREGRTHAKALGSVGGCALTEIGCCSRAFGLRVPIHHRRMTMRGWFSKRQISELKISQWNNKSKSKNKSYKSPKSPIITRKEQFAAQMRNSPTSSENRLHCAMRRIRHEVGWVISTQVVIGPYIVDILIPNRKVVVEVDGDSHRGRETYDRGRDLFLWSYGFRVIRVTNDDVWRDLNGTVLKIVSFCEEHGKKFNGWKHKRKR